MQATEAARALVTGTSSGIGAAIARRLLAQGWQVQGLDIAPACIQDAHFQPLQVDLADGALLTRLIGSLLSAGPPLALVHAAGVMRPATLGELNPEAGELMWRVHVDAATRMADLLLPAMVKAGAGRVVLLSSRISSGMPGRSQYAGSKAALVSLARSWAAEVAASGVTVNVVSPSATDTPMLTNPQRQGSAPRLPPLGRLIQPAEVAALVAYLLSPDAAAITGQDIAICGGSSLPR